MSARLRRRVGLPPTDAAASHTDWLTLTTPTLPFLSVPVLSAAFPTGPNRIPPGLRAEVLNRWEGTELDDGAVRDTDRGDWVRWVIAELLDHGDRITPGDRFTAAGSDPHTSISATLAVVDKPDEPENSPARMLVLVLPGGTSPDGRAGDAWSATWTQRMALLCRTTGCRIGLVTDGELLRFVWAPEKSSTGHATWRASLFSSERAHLESMWTVFHARQFFAARPDEQPEALLERSEAAEAEVTDTLGRQVRQAVEVLVVALDRTHRDPETPQLFSGVAPETIYDGAVTVLMRLVFLLAAEENELLPSTNRLYSTEYAITTLRGDLEGAARLGRERLEQRSSAWHRILAATRAVHGGVNHELLRIKPYGGRLFDPDRYPFLEGRTFDHQAPWWTDPGRPPLVDDLTVLEIMRALQVLQLSATDTRTLSYRNIEVEQIGHVYEGLLDHNATTKDVPYVGLVGKAGEEPEVPLADLEGSRLAGRERLIRLLKSLTAKSPKVIGELLDATPHPQRMLALRTACGGDQVLADRVTPFLGVLRDDLRGYPMVFPPGAIYVTQTGSRRDTGTAYTTRNLAEEVAEHALAPLCYDPGPQDTPERDEWRIRSSEDILNLKVCDPAVGSGAILVAAGRYLADALVEAWIAERSLDPSDLVSASDNPARNEHRARAIRLVAERCCYGVDRNPMAVEMAKMSFWLTTMAQDRPFSYLDHNLRCGDSLLGVTSLEQLRALHFDPAYGRRRAIGFAGIDPAETWHRIGPLVDEAMQLRLEIETTASDSARDTARKARLSERADRRIEVACAIGDLLVGCAIDSAGHSDPAEALDNALRANAGPAAAVVSRLDTAEEPAALHGLTAQTQRLLDRGKPDEALQRRPLHWSLVFPEAFAQGRTGFDLCIGNPPFSGGKKIKATAGELYRNFLVQWIANGAKGHADLVTYFFLQAARLARSFGLLATNSIAQGDSSEVGLAQILDCGWTIHRATSSANWPGAESVEIAKVWATRDLTWSTEPTLDDRAVRAIDEMLYQRPRSGWRKKRLAENADSAFIGSYVLGMGFAMSPDEASALIDKTFSNADVLFPYLDGASVNDEPNHTPRRWVINFFDWSVDRARKYPDCFAIVEELVKLERQERNARGEFKKRPPLPQRWWIYADKRPKLYRTIASLNHVLVIVRHSSTVAFARVPSSYVYQDGLAVIATESFAEFGALNSEFHRRWAFRHGSTIGHGVRYTPSDVYETFPRPSFSEEVNSSGSVLDEARSTLMAASERGLTETYKAFNDRRVTDQEIVKLRDLHIALDYAVRDAYGWAELLPDLKHGFHEVRLQGERLTFAPEVADEVLDLLLEENKRRYEAEVSRGLHTDSRRWRSRYGDTMFDQEVDYAEEDREYECDDEDGETE